MKLLLVLLLKHNIYNGIQGRPVTLNLGVLRLYVCNPRTQVKYLLPKSKWPHPQIQGNGPPLQWIIKYRIWLPNCSIMLLIFRLHRIQWSRHRRIAQFYKTRELQQELIKTQVTRFINNWTLHYCSYMEGIHSVSHVNNCIWKIPRFFLKIRADSKNVANPKHKF